MQFPTINQFISEYLCVPDRNSTQMIFPYRGTSLDFPGQEDMIHMGYWIWSRLSDAPLPFTALLGRERVENWLYQVFLKAVLPVPRTEYEQQQIFSPLNLTFIFRVAIHLHQTGYPSHWLASVLESILANEVTASVRPPRQNPLTPEACAKSFPARRLNVAPFLAEFRTLAAQWTAVLPFGLQSAHIPPKTRIRRYTLNVWPINREDKDRFGLVPAFILVFWDNEGQGSHGRIWRMNLRSVLLPDEKGSKDAAAVKMREGGLSVVGVWSFDSVKDEASFWMDEDVVKKWKNEDWMAQIWREDTHRPVSSPVSVTRVPQDEATMVWNGPMIGFPLNGLSEGEYWSA
jgi:hypothetical protein